jgi:hypothetical protein
LSARGTIVIALDVEKIGIQELVARAAEPTAHAGGSVGDVDIA